jgi:hypothetical protein
MDVDFNNLRKKTIEDYNNLVNGLNMASIVIPLHKFGYIQKYMDDLRVDLATLGLLYEEGNENCKCIFDGSFEAKIYTPNEEV